MNLLISTSSNPYRNLATEEYLLKYSNEDFLFLYINQPCVVVGKHQITPKEINSQYAFEHNILIARRLSGGGTVYHDEGNLNFSFIQSVLPGENISYKIITSPIFNFLLEQGVEVVMSERNDMMVAGKKISGSAMHIYKSRVLAHGTLLIDSDLENLSACLKGNSERYADKSIASKRSRVMNLKAIDIKKNTGYILNSMSDYFANKTGNSISAPLTDSANKTIDNLAADKYASPDWIYGYSPKYTYSTAITVNGNKIHFNLGIEKGVIEKISIESGDEIDSTVKLKLNKLIGEKHIFHSLKLLLANDQANGLGRELLDALF